MVDPALSSHMPKKAAGRELQSEATQDCRDCVLYKPVKSKPATQDLSSFLQP